METVIPRIRVRKLSHRKGLCLTQGSEPMNREARPWTLAPEPGLLTLTTESSPPFALCRLPSIPGPWWMRSWTTHLAQGLGFALWLEIVITCIVSKINTAGCDHSNRFYLGTPPSREKNWTSFQFVQRWLGFEGGMQGWGVAGMVSGDYVVSGSKTWQKAGNGGLVHVKLIWVW